MEKKKIRRTVITPVDGSIVSLESLNYLHFMYGPQAELEIILLYVLPTLPLFFEDDPVFKQKAAARLKELEKKSISEAEQILSKVKDFMLKKGFASERIQTLQQKKEVGIARDICNCASYTKEVDALVISSHGKTKLEAFFMGEVTNKVLEYSRQLPVFLVNGNITQKRVLAGIDKSDGSVNAAEKAGYMLRGTGCKMTLFHVKRELSRFFSKNVLESEGDLEELWKNKMAQEIAPYMDKAKEKLLKVGFPESDISIKILDSSIDTATEILKEARQKGFGTIVVGRRGATCTNDFTMGSVTRKIVQDSKGLSIWVVD